MRARDSHHFVSLNKMVARLALIALLSACVSASGDAGCISYGNARSTMPRPLPDDALGQWVAETDSRMTGTCR